MELLVAPAAIFEKHGDRIWHTGLVNAGSLLITTLWIENPERVLGAASRDRRPGWSPEGLICVTDFLEEKDVPMRLVTASGSEVEFHGVLTLDLASVSNLGPLVGFRIDIPELKVTYSAPL